MHAYIDAHNQILIDECTVYEVKDISGLKTQYENMTFSYQRIYNIIFQKVVHKGGESEINYIKFFQNDRALTISAGTSYTEDNLIQALSDDL